MTASCSGIDAALISAFARYGNGILGSERFVLPDVQALYTKIWTAC